MKVLIASLFLVGFMSCAHHGGHGHNHGKKVHDEKCADGSCDLKDKKACCKKKAES